MSEIQTNKNLNTSKFLIIALGIVLVISVGINFLLILPHGLKSLNHTDKIAGAIIQPVSDKEIYPMFACSCLGKPIDQFTCPLANDRRTFIVM